MSGGFQPNPPVVAVLAFDGVTLANLAVPGELFRHAGYEIRVCSERAEVQTVHMSLRMPWRLASLRKAATVIVPVWMIRIVRSAPRSCGHSGRHRREALA